jgi:DNA replication protein DnaC
MILITLTIAIVVLLLAALNRNASVPALYGNNYGATFGNSSEHLSRINHGFALTGSRSITKELSYTNVLLSGSTGSGKTSVVILSSLASLARGRSSIVFK